MELNIAQELINELGIPQLVDVRSQLPVNPKYTWAQLAGVRKLESLTTIALHHDAIRKSQRAGWNDLDYIKNIAQRHIEYVGNEPNGDAGCPYHVIIRSGTVYLCNNIEDRIYGVTDNNGYTVHVCVAGEYAFTDSLTDADRKALIGVLIALKQSLPSYKAIKAHKELDSTSCPGYDFSGIRNDVQTVEMKLQRNTTIAARRERAFAVANQATYMYNLTSQNDGDAEWAFNWLDEVYDIMKSKNLL